MASHIRNKVHVVWFKRDLRLVDHRPLAAALEQGPVLPLVVIEPEWWREPDMSARQYGFYTECLQDLSASLQDLGQPLLVHVSDVVGALSRINASLGIAGLWSHEETGNMWSFDRDRNVTAWCANAGIPWREFRQDGVVRRLASRNGWADKWDKLMAEPITPMPRALPPVQHGLETHRVPGAHELGLKTTDAPLRQRGGRGQALSLLSSFLTKRGEPYRVAMSSPIEGEDACSRLSPYLAWGAVSMREVAQATWARQRALKVIGTPAVSQWRGSLKSFTGRLHWHCHFMQKLEDETRLEFENLHPAYDELRSPDDLDGMRLDAWAKGETGLPFVDACMRYLDATGWLNFRMRAMVMAVASYHLWLHWRAPGLHLARQFTDYEPGIHWPQVQMQSGTTGINTVRIYNPVKQGYDQDPDGSFVRRWVPELAGIDGSLVHEPWKSSEASSVLDKTYPLPIIDHMQAAREARQEIYGARKGGMFRQVAGEIAEKHASRKSGRTSAAPKRRGRNRAASANEAQLALVLEAAEDIGGDTT